MSCENKENSSSMSVIVSFLIEKNNKILITRQAADADRDKGLWFLPGGHIEKGETLIEAVAREGKEELGRRIDFEEIVGYGEIFNRDRQSIVLVCRCSMDGEEIQTGGDVDDYEWIDPEDFYQFPLRPVVNLQLNHQPQILKLGNFSILLN
jgi:ADP-ribose pyrophosphatase YjhB (NUDIX family)